MKGAIEASSPNISVKMEQGSDSVPLSWFPLPTSLWDGMADIYKDDPSIPMPDLVVCRHKLMPSRLAVRALDLAPYLTIDQKNVSGLSSAILRQGMAFSPDRGTIQAAVPLLRIPALSVVGDGVAPMHGSEAWSAADFGEVLRAWSARLSPPSAPMAYLPVSTLFGAAVVGSGGAVARTTATDCIAVFGQQPAVSALGSLIEWTRYCFNSSGPDLKWAVWLGSGEHVLKYGGAPIGGMAGNWFGWRVAPIPVFPMRPAVPTDNIDVMVFRHTRHRREASAMAIRLLATRSQEKLRSYHGGLLLRAAPATDQLRGVLSRFLGASILADPTWDITAEDVYGGEETLQNAGAVGRMRSALTGVLSTLTGSRGGYFNARAPEEAPLIGQVTSALRSAEQMAE